MARTTPESGAQPLSQEWRLGCGLDARFEMPDMLKFADGSFEIPNHAQADVYELIYGTGLWGNELQQLEFSRQKLRGLYALMAIVMVHPVLQLDDEERKPGELSPRQIAWLDLTAAYNFFRFGPPAEIPAAESAQPESGASPEHLSGNVPPAAE